MTSSHDDKIGKRSSEKTPLPSGNLAGRRRKDLPSIQHMLVHGAPESQGKPTTFWSIIAFPLALLLTFVVSLYIFEIAPHQLSVGKRHVLPPAITDNLPKSKLFNLGKPTKKNSNGVNADKEGNNVEL